MEAWLERQVRRHVGDLARLTAASSDRHYGPPVRALTAMLADAGGLLPRKALAEPIGQLDRPMRAALHKLKVRLGALDVFAPSLLKPEAQRWRAALVAVRSGQPMPVLPRPGASVLSADADRLGAALAYRRFGDLWIRVDLADRLAAFAYQARAAHKVGGEAALDPIDRALVTSLGLTDDTLARLMAEVGFREQSGSWAWRGTHSRTRARPQPARPGNAFAALAGLKR
jgi:ATP-dependent RNA helicase SUPV3L1/SUV3